MKRAVEVKAAAKRSRRKSAGVPRVVLSLPLLLRALLLSDEQSRALRQCWQQGRCVPVIGSALVTQLLQALSFPGLKLRPAQQHELLADLLPYAEAHAGEPAVLGTRLARPLAQSLALAVAAQVDLLLDEGQVLSAHVARMGAARYGRLRVQDAATFLSEV